MTKKKKEKLHGPVSVILILTLIISIISSIMSIFGIDGYKTVIQNGTMETALVTVKNVISLEGIKFIIGNAVNNFRTLEPLVLIIISLLGISICEKSGLLNAMFNPLKRVKLNIIIFITLLIGIISSIIGDNSYVLLIPLIGVMYKYLGKNPILGVIIIFLGITIGYGFGLFFNYNDYLLGNLSELAAITSIDKNYTYNLFSDLFIMIFSTIIVSFIGTIVINKFLVNKLPKKYSYEEEELIISKKAKRIALLGGLLLSLIFIYMILPINTIGAGILLDKSADRYMEQLFGANSAFGNGLIIIITAIMITCGMLYGKFSGNIKNSHEFSLSMSKTFENLGFMFVLMFFGSQLVSIIEWSNVGIVITTKLIDLISTLEISGIFLIIIFFIIIILTSILVPNSYLKWQIVSPVAIPLFMRSNITPNMTQFIFKAADGIGKALTPTFIYYIIMLAFIEKYRVSEKNQVSVFGTLKIILPVVLIMAMVILLIILLWYIIGLPIGIGTYSTL